MQLYGNGLRIVALARAIRKAENELLQSQGTGPYYLGVSINAASLTSIGGNALCKNLRKISRGHLLKKLPMLLDSIG